MSDRTGVLALTGFHNTCTLDGEGGATRTPDSDNELAWQEWQLHQGKQHVRNRLREAVSYGFHLVACSRQPSLYFWLLQPCTKHARRRLMWAPVRPHHFQSNYLPD